MLVQTGSRQTRISNVRIGPLSRGQTAAMTGLILILLLTLAASSSYCVWVFLQRTERLYRGHIYPHVYALGVDLGGLTTPEAEHALGEVARYVDPGPVKLTDGQQIWTYDWLEVGAYVDVEAMAHIAFNVGRGGGWRNQLKVWLNYHDVHPVLGFDENAARVMLNALAAEVNIPVTQPTLQLENAEVIVIPGKQGLALDVEGTLERLRLVNQTDAVYEIELALQAIEPVQPDTADVKQQAEQFLQRQLTVSAYDVVTEQTLSWVLDREEIATWLTLVPGEDGSPTVTINKYKIRDTLVQLAEFMGDGRGFRYEEAVDQIWEAFRVGQPAVFVYLTHPERTYAVQAGDTLTRIARRFGIPAGLVAEANRDIDIDVLSIGQVIRIPSQDIVTPYMPVPGKKIVVSLVEQRVRVYENGVLIWDWVTSTGMSDSPTANGIFQVIEKEDKAYASQWDLWMPYFIGVYEAGGGVINGFHELPILANGQRLWAGSLGRPASFGCIILGIPQAETLYHWAEIGVTVVIE
ncbi:MAG: peptidoglycan binding domain-containing protein [Anaerolineae bacterium]|nr:peptidoglycan binding domain-containing protein [Anaerolineae bacterium]